MSGTIRLEEQIEIPMEIRSLAAFRCWAVSDTFPQQGRIDFLAGSMEVEMSPEDPFCHGILKGEIHAVLHRRVKQHGLGHLFVDRTRVSCVEADLSIEPDVVFVSTASRAAGRSRLVAKSGGQPGRYVEIEGAVDLIVEVVSDRSVVKDTQRLPEAYVRAGVTEFWLADARGESLLFQIHRLVESAYRAVVPDADGFQRSDVFDCPFRLDGNRNTQGEWTFDLLAKG